MSKIIDIVIITMMITIIAVGFFSFISLSVIQSSEKEDIRSFCYKNTSKSCYDYCMNKSKLSSQDYCIEIAQKVKFIEELK